MRSLPRQLGLERVAVGPVAPHDTLVVVELKLRDPLVLAPLVDRPGFVSGTP
jgi:hypothetical protein